jgi:hypothetical protein
MAFPETEQNNCLRQGKLVRNRTSPSPGSEPLSAVNYGCFHKSGHTPSLPPFFFQRVDGEGLGISLPEGEGNSVMQEFCRAFWKAK